jgi:hypothetical protein
LLDDPVNILEQGCRCCSSTDEGVAALPLGICTSTVLEWNTTTHAGCNSVPACRSTVVVCKQNGNGSAASNQQQRGYGFTARYLHMSRAGIAGAPPMVDVQACQLQRSTVLVFASGMEADLPLGTDKQRVTALPLGICI